MKVVNHLVGRKKVMIAPGVKLMMIWKVSWLTDTAIHDMIIIEAARPSGHIGPRGPIHCLPPPWECFSCVLIIIIAVRKRGSYLEYERNYSRHCQSNGWYMTEKNECNMVTSTCSRWKSCSSFHQSSSSPSPCHLPWVGKHWKRNSGSDRWCSCWATCQSQEAPPNSTLWKQFKQKAQGKKTAKEKTRLS